MPETSFKSGFIAIIGAPNVGKSTLLNLLVGEKIAIISPKPQTTRTRILGVRTTDHYQMVFLDTPGIHQARGQLNLAMVRTAVATLETVDLILFLVEAHKPRDRENNTVLEVLQRVKTPVFLAVNKIDLTGEASLPEIVENWSSRYPFAQKACISALYQSGIQELLDKIAAMLPPGPPYYDEDTLTDIPERAICAEIIREKIIHLTSEEIPYATAVTISSFKEDPERNLIRIHAEVHVERPSQKGIIIGKKGSMLRQIGQQARLDMEHLLGARVYLELWVKVRKKWRKDPRALREFGYM
ncbi:MAG: GTPase Era [Deltaproteobacteria bacterium]|nr:GTPase Era [Deltaproteobacteria bacterium]MBW2071655.1 GTPase Era [Deltaproteobacteria bacterium]